MLEDLNEQQRIAVMHVGTPQIVLSGAGAGKTRVITYKFAYLVSERGIDPSRILAITFTRKAAKEMRDRIEAMLSIRPQSVLTFHSFSAKLLRQHIEQLNKGHTSKFIIYDENDSMKTLKNVFKELKLDVKEIDRARAIISRAKQAYHDSVPDYLASLPFHTSHFVPVFQAYQNELLRNNALDFDDIVYLAVELLLKHQGICSSYQKKFAFLMVDEFQDTNEVQYLMLTLLAGANPNICVVCDPNQSVYGWRGATPQNILTFADEFRAVEHKLERNYRSTRRILEIANTVISKADSTWTGRVPILWTQKEDTGRAVHIRCPDSYSECKEITERIESLVSEKRYSYSDIAVLMRLSFLSHGVEQALMTAGIPYQVVKGLAFYDRAEIKDLLSYLRLIINPTDQPSFERIINVPPRGLGQRAVQTIAQHYRTDWLQALRDANLPSKQRQASDEFLALIDGYADLADAKPYSTLKALIEDVGYDGYLLDRYKDYEEKIGNVSELLNILKAMEGETSFTEFMEDSALTTEQDRLDPKAGVQLLTVHAAKGLEWPLVFVVGVEENLFPSARALQKNESAQEERRLFYVAVTRAKDQLFLTTTKHRSKFGDSQPAYPSRYLDEIDELVETETRDLCIGVSTVPIRDQEE